MNNPIIVDGVDVSGCDRYCKFDNRNEKNKCSSYISEGYNDCKPKEYQCFFYVKEIEKQLQRLKAENERLKKEVSDLNFYIDNYKITWEIDKCEKYKQALQDVREIAKLHQYFNPEILEIKGNLGQIQDLKMTEIYEKINEVLK